MADDYATWRPQAEADWTSEDVEMLRRERDAARDHAERLGTAGEVYFAELRDDIKRLRAAIIAICTTLDNEGRIAPGALETARMLVYPAGDGALAPCPEAPEEAA